MLQNKQYKNVLAANKIKGRFLVIRRVGVFGKLKGLLLLLYCIARYAGHAQEIIIGDARSIFSKLFILFGNLFNRRIVLVDDGLYLLSYISKVLDKRYVIYTKLPLEKVVRSCVSRLYIVPQEVKKIEIIPANSVSFVGMKLVEIGYLDEDIYIKILQEVAYKGKGSGKNLIYYAHREESDNKLSLIESLGYKVIKSELPVEQLLERDGAPSGSYYSLYSTAIYNLSKSIAGSKFYSYRIDKFYWPAHAREAIEQCYDLLKISGIEILDIRF
ncbi:hypothetical protein SAMN02745148_03579 [Modicisalibacter ilicicola DSM 19980]|uniref:Uncharacterized protein n=2 Tax=Modicisalibacter ilicicola TaxID=480814 RepID=A0A1M5EP15_9GAMM|nr:hypothetical protein SAMN02745148_03579 [Halomonas ilicicola DSM 19980]